MSGVRYLPGEDWLSIVRSGVVVMVPETTPWDVIDRLWKQLGENPDLQAILPIVAGGFGQGLESMPPFGVVSSAKRLHVLLRGAVHLRVADRDDDSVGLSGEHVTTWTERIFDSGADHFTLSAGSAGAGPEGLTFPLEAGVVRASVVSVGSFASSGSFGSAGSLGSVGSLGSRSAPAAVVAEPALSSAITPVDSAGASDPDDTDPEQAMTGALEAEELATINPNLYLTSTEAAEPESAQEPGHEAELQTTGYDHLWDQTVVRRVEDAAVRPPEEGEPSAVALEPDAEEQHGESARATTAETESAEVPAVPPSYPSAEPELIPPSAPGQLIDSVPWARKSTGAGEPGTVPVAPAPAGRTPTPPGIPTPSVPTPNAPAPVPNPNQAEATDSDDHDGQTIMRSDLHNPPPPQVQASPDARPGTGPLVLARLCGQGHANPPESSDCSVCSQPLDGEPREVRRPSLGTMRISTGEVVELDQSLIIGRQPSVARVQGRGMPKLVQVTSAGGDISRSHVEVRLDGWHVLLCDLRATNGTVLIRPAQPPRRLGEGETAFLLDGDVAQLGDDVFLRFEGLR